MNNKITYSKAILEGFRYLLENYPETFIIGQGVWSPWYVGSTMSDLEKVYGKNRIIDTPTSESAVTGLALGASISGKKPIVVHPRIDFMLYATDAIVNQAAKWNHMFGGQQSPDLTIRGIINRGGEQGAQHSQALHAWFAHVPGLRVVMPSSVSDARDLLIASVLCNEPVLYFDDRWLYEIEDNLEPIKEKNLIDIKPKVLNSGDSFTVVSCGYSTQICLDAAKELSKDNISIEIIDLRVITNIDYSKIISSILKTKKLLCVDGGWSSCGISAEIIASVYEKVDPNIMLTRPKRITLFESPAPTSAALEIEYYPSMKDIINYCKEYNDI